MALLARSDLRFAYHWPAGSAAPPPGPFPGPGPLARGDGPAVLGFVNAVAEASGWTDKALGRKVEALLHAMPAGAVTGLQAYAWMEAHWNAYPPVE